MKNGTYTLNERSNANGNQAYILKSPLNENELFVVEFRKKPDVIVPCCSMRSLHLQAGRLPSCGQLAKHLLAQGGLR